MLSVPLLLGYRQSRTRRVILIQVKKDTPSSEVRQNYFKLSRRGANHLFAHPSPHCSILHLRLS